MRLDASVQTAYLGLFIPSLAALPLTDLNDLSPKWTELSYDVVLRSLGHQATELEPYYPRNL